MSAQLERAVGRDVHVPLDDTEQLIAATVGTQRRLGVLRRGLGHGHGNFDIGAWDRHMVGALAELALAKYLGVYWCGAMDDFGKAGDVAGIEVRATTHARGHLIAYANDPDERILVLGVVEMAGVRFVGGIRGVRAKQIEYTPPPGKQRPNAVPTYWVPQTALALSMASLRAATRSGGVR